MLSKIDVIAVGQLKKGPEFELCEEYLKRLGASVKIHEIESKLKDPTAAQADEQKKIMKLIHENSFLIALDERGKTLSSVEFAQTLEKAANVWKSRIQFVIGGADGLGAELKSHARLVLSFGRQTWPHMLARAMLLEQIYRAQQILKGHPYHRE